MIAVDPYFGAPSPLTIDEAIVGEGGDGGSQEQLLQKLGTLKTAALGVRRCLFPKAERIVTDQKLKAANERMIEALTSRQEDLTGNPELLKHVSDFQALVPVVLPAKKASLIVAQDDGAIALARALDRYDAGQVGDEYLRKLIAGLSGMSGVKLAESGLGVVAQAERLQEDLAAMQGTGARWVERGRGSENRVYTGEHGMVYKICAIKEHILDIPRIHSTDPLYPRLCSYPLAAAHGECPLIERLIHAASIPGIAMADIVGLTPQGEVIFKQLDLGDREPGMDQVSAWVQIAGAKALPSQQEDPRRQITGDTSILPFVSLIGNKPVLGLDLNPRNCRFYQGRTVPFDLVTRELTASEVRNHREIASAVQQLEREHGIHTGGGLRPLNTPVLHQALEISR